MSQYAGQQLLTGQQAEVYANDFINVHLGEIGGGKTYAQLSAAAMALPKGSPAYTAAEAKVQTDFQGTTLRGLLLEAYGFSLIAEIAFWCAIAAFALAGIMAVLVGLGFAHARRTGEDEETHAQPRPARSARHGAVVLDGSRSAVRCTIPPLGAGIGRGSAVHGQFRRGGSGRGICQTQRGRKPPPCEVRGRGSRNNVLALGR